MGGGGTGGGAATGVSKKNQNTPPAIPRQPTSNTMPTMPMTMIATTDIACPPPDAGPAVAVPGCRLMPQWGQTRSSVPSVFEQEGQTFIDDRGSVSAFPEFQIPDQE